MKNRIYYKNATSNLLYFVENETVFCVQNETTSFESAISIKRFWQRVELGQITKIENPFKKD